MISLEPAQSFAAEVVASLSRPEQQLQDVPLQPELRADQVPSLAPLSIPRRLAPLAAVPPALFLPSPKAAERFFDFFTAKLDFIHFKAGSLNFASIRWLP